MVSLEMCVFSTLFTAAAFALWQQSFLAGAFMFWFLMTVMGIADWIVNSVWFGRIDEQDRKNSGN